MKGIIGYAVVCVITLCATVYFEILNIPAQVFIACIGCCIGEYVCKWLNSR